MLLQLAKIGDFTGTGIFVVKPAESKAGDPEVDATQGKRLKVKIYGDYESVEHAKTRVLIMIDDLVRLMAFPQTKTKKKKEKKRL